MKYSEHKKGKGYSTLSQEVDVSMSWNDFKFMLIQEFCPSHEMQKLESELWNYAMVGAGHAAYTDRFHELARLVPYLVTLENRIIERYVYGLAPQIRGMVATTEPKTMQKAACSFMLCDLDFEPLSLSLSSLPSCDLMSLTNMLILLHYLESFKSELAENLGKSLYQGACLMLSQQDFPSSIVNTLVSLDILANIINDIGVGLLITACELDDVQ
ncbi:reverse transcriptase domain-containing protein [Tanacetum coccineum]